MKIPERLGLRLFFETSKRSIRKCLIHDDVPLYVAALAYRALFALFPFFALLVALLGILEVVSFFDWLIDQAYSTFQEQYAGLGKRVIEEIQYKTQG